MSMPSSSPTIVKILEKLANKCLTYPYFILHKDGNKDNNAVTNLCYVLLKSAWKNFDSWGKNVDWWIFLEDDEIQHLVNIFHKTISTNTFVLSPYKQVNLEDANGDIQTPFVHRLVAATFMSPPLDSPLVNVGS